MRREPSGFSHWSNLRDGVTAVREMMVVVLILAFLLMPGRVQKFLFDAGIRSFAGVEFDTEKLAAAQRELMIAKSGIDDVQSQLDVVTSSLVELQASQEPFSPSHSSVHDFRTQRSAEMTVDVAGLLDSLQQAQVKSRDINQRIDRARKYSRDSVSQSQLLPPETLFGTPNAGNNLAPLR